MAMRCALSLSEHDTGIGFSLTRTMSASAEGWNITSALLCTLKVHAHGGGILHQNGTFYWYGTTQKYPPAWISKGVNLYSSPDLQTWTFEGLLFEDAQIMGVPFPHPYRIERPKVGSMSSGSTRVQLQNDILRNAAAARADSVQRTG